jgi:ABC-type proline/glycine betaine transport system permease subunit
MNVSTFGEHLLISLVPWLAGATVGGGLGYACALVARRLFSTFPGLRKASMLLPWRTAAVTLPLLSPLVVILVGLGVVAGATMVGLFVLLFALPFTVVALLEQWYPSPLAVRLIAGARTLATASVAVAAVGPPVAGSGGAGVLIFQQGMRLLDYSQMLMGFSIVVFLALMIDVLLGALQLLFSCTQVPAV